MKRQRGRNRGGGGSNSGGGGGGGGKQSHNANRAFDSNGPDGVKIRGHAQHVYEKYQQLARDASASSDRVLAENYLQHAEHYYRVLRSIQPTRPYTEIVGRDGFGSNYDIDFEDESGGQAQDEGDSGAEAGGNNNGSNNGNSEGGGYEQPRDRFEGGQGRQDSREFRGEGRQDRDNRQDRDRQGGEGRQDRDRQDRGPRQDNQPRQDRDQPRQDNQPRQDRDQPRQDRDNQPRQDRGDRPRYEGRRDYGRDQGRNGDEPRRYGEGASDPLAVVEPQATPLTPVPEARPEPREDKATMLRSHDGDVSHAPAFLQAAAPSDEDAPRKVRKPRAAKPKATETEEA